MDFVEYFSSLLSSFNISAIHFFFFFLLALHKLHFLLVKNLSGIDFPFNIFSFTRLFDFWLLLYYYFILWGLPISSFSPVSGLSQCFYLLTHFCCSIQLLVHSKCSAPGVVLLSGLGLHWLLCCPSQPTHNSIIIKAWGPSEMSKSYLVAVYNA